MKQSKQSFVSSLQNIVNALQQPENAGKSFVLNGKVWKTKDLVTACQGVIVLINGTQAAKAAWVKETSEAQAAKAAIVPTVDALRGYIAAAYGTSSKLYTDCGFLARKRGAPSAATLAQRVQKNLATRKARMTMSKKQKAKITGATALATSAPAASASAASTTSTNAASASPLNGANGPSK